TQGYFLNAPNPVVVFVELPNKLEPGVDAVGAVSENVGAALVEAGAAPKRLVPDAGAAAPNKLVPDAGAAAPKRLVPDAGAADAPKKLVPDA
ncbi:hypothetical protein BGZ49_006273, partial [Haplosporangium sp. Z 27]